MNRVIVVTVVWIVVVWSFALITAGGPSTPAGPTSTSLNPFDRWDASFYKGHATNADVARKDAFFPLYGIIVGAGMKMTKGSFELVSAVLNALLVTVTTVVLAYTSRRMKVVDEQTVPWLIAAFLSLPASYSFLAPYPTMLAVLLAILAWYFSVRQKFALAMFASCFAFFAHPAAIVAMLATTAVILGHRWRMQSVVAMLIVTATVFVSSGLMTRFLSAQQGFAVFRGVHFWQQGTWWITTYASLPAGRVVLLSMAFIAAIALLGFRKFWEYDRWLLVSAIGLFVLTILSGLWIDLPRFMLLSPLIPLVITRFRPLIRTAIIAASFLLQLSWLQGFVTWKVFV